MTILLKNGGNNKYMLKLNSNIFKIKIGDTVKCGRTVYTIVATFEDEGSIYYVGKYINKDNIPYYSNILTYIGEHILFKHV